MLLWHSVGTGKCHAKDTNILMHDGTIKKVQDIVVGDLLMGDDSKPRTVLSLAQGEDEMYDIVPTKGDKYTVNSEHVLVLKYNSSSITYLPKRQPNLPYKASFIDKYTLKVKSKAFKTKEEADDFINTIPEQDKIVEIEVKDLLNLSPSLQKELKGIRSGVEFPDKSVPLDPYFLGIWLGDGSSRTSKIITADKEILDYVTKEVAKYNLVNNKHIPHDYLVNSRENRLKLLAGLLDTDGYYCKKGFEITQKSDALADSILFLARSLGFAAYKGEKKEGVYNRIFISGNFEDLPTLLPRKQATERSQDKDVLVTGINVQHIGKGQYYGFTLDGNNRYLLGDFTITHNTCTAIATASSTFEPMGYSIIYVTRYTLKGDVWKNMFEQACSVIIQERLKSGMPLPEAHAARLRLLSRGWFEPISYRQFSNLLAGKNQLHEKLIGLNGKKDPLHKTLVIIDEAHKLFALDVEGQEKADIEVIRKALVHSNTVSGKDGVKLLLMTATPYTSDPMDLIRLLNLCRPANKLIPDTFNDFASEYLNEEGIFTDDGKAKFYNELTGYISYLNREKDIRSFAYPVIHNVKVQMSEYEYKDIIDPYIDIKHDYERNKRDLHSNLKFIDEDVANMKATENKVLEILMKPKLREYKNCIKSIGITKQDQKKQIKDTHKKDLKECTNILKEIKKKIKDDYKEKVAKLKADAKEAKKGKTKEEKAEIKKKLKEAIKKLDMDEEYDIDDAGKNPDYKGKTTSSGKKQSYMGCVNDANKKYKDNMKNPPVLPNVQDCDKIKEANEKYAEDYKIKSQERINKFKENKLKHYEIDKVNLEKQRLEFERMNEELNKKQAADISQQTGLDGCLKKDINPLHSVLLTGDSILSASKEEEIMDDLENQGVLDNIYLINGHGFENVIDFEHRNVMPDDKVLIVFPVCARPNYMDTGCQFMELFDNPDNKKILRNPIKYRKEISRILKRPIRIYLPGEYVPEMTTTLFLQFTKQTTVIAKSGVYRMGNIPKMDRNVLREAQNGIELLGSQSCKEFSGVINRPIDYTSEVHKNVYKGNIYKPANKRDTFNKLSERYFKIKDILHDTGTGIYYYMGCRSSSTQIAPERYIKILEKSDSQQKTGKRSGKISPVLKKLKGKHAVSSSSASSSTSPVKTPIPSSSSSSSSESPKPKKKEKVLANTRAEKERLKEIEELIDEVQQNLHTETIDKLVTKWREELSKMIQTKVVENVVKSLDVLEKLYEMREDAEDELTTKNITVEDKTFLQFTFVSTLVVNGVKYRFHPRIYGYVQQELRDKENKCSSAILIKRIQKLYKRGELITLPKKINAWLSKSKNPLGELCKYTAKKLQKSD